MLTWNLVRRRRRLSGDVRRQLDCKGRQAALAAGYAEREAPVQPGRQLSITLYFLQ